MRFKSGECVSAQRDPRQTKAHTLCRQTRIDRVIRVTVVSMSLVGLAACSGIHLNDLTASAPQKPAATEAVDTAPGAITGSVTPGGSLGYAGSEHTDWDLVLATVNTSLSAPPSARIEWSNKSTGDSGTITDLTPIAAKKPRDCRAFSTTIASVDGVRLYHAEVCKSFMNTWEFAKLIAADSG